MSVLERLRPGSFCAEPKESVLRPWLGSSLLPQASRSARHSFAIGLFVIMIALAVLVEFRLPGAIITVSALGLALLLVICWLRAGVLGELPRWSLVTTVVLAVGLAAGWVLLTGDVITTMAESAFGAGTVGRRVLRDGLGIAEGGALLMLVPAVIVRLLWQSRRHPLDGFVIGALSAVLFTSTATLTRLAPQFITAPVARNQPVHWLFFEVVVRGMTIPLTAACAGGLVGIALWSDRAAGRAVLLVLALAVLGEFAVIGWADIESRSQFTVLAWHLGMAIIALIGLRVGLQVALLAEGGGWTPATAKWSPVPVLAIWMAVMTALSVIAVAGPAVTVKPQSRYNCPPDCGSPPRGRPVSANPRFTAPDGSYSAGYPAPGTAYDVRIDETGVTATFIAGDGGKLRLTSEPAAGRTAQDVAHAFITTRFPSATTAFEIPNAMVGFQPGYGEVADVSPLKVESGTTRMRAVVVVAVKNDLALIAAAIGPYHEFGPSFGPGRPSPTNLQIAEDMGRYVNGFRWRGDPPG